MSRNAIIWTNLTITASALSIGGLLAPDRHGIVLWAGWAGVAMAAGAGLVGFVVSMDENAYPFREGDRGTVGGLLGGLTGLLAVGFGGVMFYYGLPAVLLCVGALWSITMAGVPLYLRLKERPERKRLAAEQQQREIEAMERELGLR